MEKYRNLEFADVSRATYETAHNCTVDEAMCFEKALSTCKGGVDSQAATAATAVMLCLY